MLLRMYICIHVISSLFKIRLGTSEFVKNKRLKFFKTFV